MQREVKISVGSAVLGSAGNGGRRVGVHNNSFTDV